MSSKVLFRSLAVVLFASTGLAPLAAAHAAPCPASGSALTVGSVASVAPGAARTFALDLQAGQGFIVDLAAVDPAPRQSSGDEDEHGEGQRPAAPRALSLCDAGGKQLVPQPGEVFEKGSSVIETPDGERLRFVAPANGRYLIAVAAADQPRELLARRRVLAGNGGVVAARLGSTQDGTITSAQPQVFSFAGTAGQWVELKSTSERDTVLNLAAPAGDGGYAVVAKVDDSDGLNPIVRRKLPVTGTYYVQVESLSDEAGEFTLSLKTIAPPPPLPAPLALRTGTTATGKLADEKAFRVYALPVTAGHSYRLELTADYDAVVAIGLPNPLETDDGEARSAFSEAKTQDEGVTGTERLMFTARTNGELLVIVRSFGIGDTDGSYTLAVREIVG